MLRGRRLNGFTLAPGVVLLVAWMLRVGDVSRLGAFGPWAEAHAALWAILSMGWMLIRPKLLPTRDAGIEWRSRKFAAAAWGVPAFATAPVLFGSPLAALVAVVVLWRVQESLVGPTWRHDEDGEEIAASPWLPPGLVWLVGVVVGVADSPIAWAAVAVSLGAAATACASSQQLRDRWKPRSRALAWAGIVLGMAASVFGWEALGLSLVLAILYSSAGAITVEEDENDDTPGFWDDVLSDPARTMVLSFVLVGLLGGLALASPAAMEGQHISLLDGMFTSFSATCVTGLTVVDTPTTFSPVGEVILLALIQVGGLGIMTFSTAGASLLRRRLSLAREAAMAELMATDDRRGLYTEVRRVVALTLLVELAGGTVLAALFWLDGDTAKMAVWRGVFTSISAFCNAGFALQSDNLIPYADDPAVLYTVASLIMAGGLGPAVLFALPAIAKRRQIPVGVRLALWTSAAFWLVPAVLFFSLERSTTLAQLPALDAIHNSIFHSVTLRTAGFNSVDLTGARPATIAMMVFVMFIGGCPGSTAGGIKTTTFAVLMLSAAAVARGRLEVVAFGYRLPAATVLRANAVGLMGLLSVTLFVFSLLATQHIEFSSLLFETVSALGTVGLSVGATAELDPTGKLLIIFAMFAGRVGPLTIVFLFAGRLNDPLIIRPEQDISVG